MLSVMVVPLFAAVPTMVWRIEGRIDAERDIAARTMKWKIYGHMAGHSATDRAARGRLRDRFGLKLEAVAQCVVTRELVEHADGYNARIRAEVGRTHGADEIDRAWDEAHGDAERTQAAGAWWVVLILGAAGIIGLRRYRRVPKPADVGP